MGDKRKVEKTSQQAPPVKSEKGTGLFRSVVQWNKADEKDVDDGYTMIHSKRNKTQTEARVEVKQADLVDILTEASSTFYIPIQWSL